MIQLSNEISDFAIQRQKIEETLPYSDPKLPIGKGKHRYDQNPAQAEWDSYYAKTQWEFRKGKGAYAYRCSQLLDVLPKEELPEDDVNDIKRYCVEDYPTDAKALKALSVLLGATAQRIVPKRK